MSTILAELVIAICPFLYIQLISMFEKILLIFEELNVEDDLSISVSFVALALTTICFLVMTYE